MGFESFKQSSTAGILRGAFKVLSKNGRIMSLVTLLTLLPPSLPVLYYNIIVLPYAQPLASEAAVWPIADPTSSEAAAERSELLPALRSEAAAERAELLPALRSFVIVGLLWASAIGIVWLIALTATVYSAAAIHGGKGLTLRALTWRVATTWKRPLITWLCGCALLIGMASMFSFLLLVGAAVMMLGEGIPTLPAVVVLSIFAVGVFIYFAVAWMLALVASVVEESCYGMEALGKAVVLIKGRKVQGFVLVLATSLCAAIIYGLWSLATNAKLELRIGVQIVRVCLFSIVKTVDFYCLHPFLL